MFNPVKLLGEVMSLAYLVNQNTDYCIFVSYSGHVNLLEVSIFPSKEEYQSEKRLYRSDIYLDDKRDIKSKKLLLEIKSTLESYLYPRLEE